MINEAEMIIRELTPEDVREHDKVSSQAFVYDCDIDDKSSVLPVEIMFGAFLPDWKTLMADMEIVDRKCTFGDGTLRCAAVGGVASKPEYRGRGAVTGLFEALFCDERWDISILYPFSSAYYRRLGYESIGRALQITVPFKELKGIERNSDAVLFEGENPQELLNIYNEYAKQCNLCFVRDNIDAYSAEPYKSCQYTYICDKKSYVNFSLDRAKKTLSVREIVYTDKPSLEKALGFLRNFEGNYDTMVFGKLPLDTPIVNYISNDKKAEIKCYSVGAARIHNVANVLKAHKYPDGKGNFSVEVDGKLYTVEYADGKAEVSEGLKIMPDVSLSINAASKILLSGVKGVCEAEYINGVKIFNKASDFFRAFPENDAYLNDDF